MEHCPSRHEEILFELEQVVKSRIGEDPKNFYTAELLEGGLPLLIRKLSEEQGEIFQAMLSEPRDRVVSEISDWIYHLTVAMEATGKATWQEVFDELEHRRQSKKV